LFEYSADITML